jgi:hypothetical protein
MQNMGINQLAQMYLGNPQPLAQKVQQAQQQAKPGQIPPDLEEAMALQKIQEMRNAFGNQQALQAGGPQPTVVDQLKQMLAPQQQAVAAPQGMAPGAMPGMPPQAAPQMPQMRAARGGSIESLRSNLGSEYHGGGIVAFSGEDESLVEGDDQEELAPADLTAAVKRQLAARLMAKPSDAGIAAETGARAAYAAPDTSGYDRAVAELQKRRTQMEAPKTGMPALMEYLQQIAQAPRGMGSLSAGALGAQRVDDLQKQRESAQFDLTKQILEQEQKKLDVNRGYTKEMYGINKAAIDQAYKQQFAAAKELRLSDDAAKKLAQTAADNEANRQNRLKVVQEQGKNSLATANAPGQTERIANKIIALKSKGTPEALAQAADLQSTYASLTGGGNAGVGATRNTIQALRMDMVLNQAVLKDIDSTDAEKAEARAAIADIREKLKEAGSNPVTPIKLPQDGIPATQTGSKPAAAPTVLKFDAAGNPKK